MPERTFTNVTAAVRHIPDYSIEDDGKGGKVQVELPGHVEFGFIVDGHFRRLSTFGAQGLFDDIERAQAATPPPPAVPGQ